MGVAKVSGTDVEVEWQLDALDLRPVERWFAARFAEAGTAADGTASPPVHGAASPSMSPPGFDVRPQPARRLLDTYFDTEDWRLARAGYVLRTRRRGGGLEATMKDLAATADGLRRRMEVTETLGGSGVDDLDPEGPVGRRVRALSGSRPLRPVLEVRTRRRLFSLVVHEEPIGEVALDDTTIVITGDRQRLRLQRVEVEVMASWVDPLRPFVEQLRRDCSLQPATLSKFEAGLLAAGVILPDRRVPGGADIGPGLTLGALAYAVIGRDTAAMLSHESASRLGDDPEGVHQMRVSTRRLRAALDLFAVVLPVRGQQLRAELGWLADALGTVRDLDIQLGKWEEWCESLPGEHGQALEDFGHQLAALRGQAGQQLLEALDSRRYERLVAGLGALIEQGPPRRSAEAKALAVVTLPELIGQRHRAAVKAAKRAQTSRVLGDFHRLRIRCKRLRYAIEFTAGLYGSDVKRFAKQVAVLQDVLGLIQDAEVAYLRLRTMAVGEQGETLRRSTVFAMGMVAEGCRAEAEGRLESLVAPADMLRGAAWRRASEALEEEREAAGARVDEVAPGAAVTRKGRPRRHSAPPAAANGVAPGDGTSSTAASPSIDPLRGPTER